MLAAIQEMSSNDESLAEQRIRRNHPSLYLASKRLFGGWSAALVRARMDGYLAGQAPETEPPKKESPTPDRVQMFMATTRRGSERGVVERLLHLANEQPDLGIVGADVPAGVKGYVFISTRSPERLAGIQHLIPGLKRIRLDEPVDPTAVARREVRSSISEGDIVMILAGRYQGEQGRVRSLNEERKEVTVELDDAVGIPVRVPLKHVRRVE